MVKSRDLFYPFFIFLFISQVICFAQEDPYKIMEIIGVKEGMIIGEAGAGEGFYSYILSGYVGKSGHIYANEIKSKLLWKIENHCRKEDIRNITTVKGKTTDARFPETDLDMVFMRHVLHCMKKPGLWLKNLPQYMKPGAVLVIIDGDPDVVGYGWDYLIPKEEVVRMAENAGFKLERIENSLLPEDYIFIFRRNR